MPLTVWVSLGSAREMPPPLPPAHGHGTTQSQNCHSDRQQPTVTQENTENGLVILFQKCTLGARLQPAHRTRSITARCYPRELNRHSVLDTGGEL